MPAVTAAQVVQVLQTVWVKFNQMKSNNPVACAVCARVGLLQNVCAELHEHPKLLTTHCTALSALLADLLAAVDLAGALLSQPDGFLGRVAATATRFLQSGSYADQLSELQNRLDRSLQILQASMGVDANVRVCGLRDDITTSLVLLRQLDARMATRSQVEQLVGHLSRLEVTVHTVWGTPCAPTSGAEPPAGVGSPWSSVLPPGQLAGFASALVAELRAQRELDTSAESAPVIIDPSVIAGIQATLNSVLTKLDQQNAIVQSQTAAFSGGGSTGIASPVASEFVASGAGAMPAPHYKLQPAPVFKLEQLSIDAEHVKTAASAGFGDLKHAGVLGTGSVGSVLPAQLLAYGSAHPIPVTVKIFRNSAAILSDAAGVRALQRVQDEGAIHYSLRDHPNIVLLYGLLMDREAGVLGLVMERCETSLDALLANSAVRLSLPQRVEILIQVANALAALHRRLPPILHCDLKPANVLISGPVGSPACIKVCDFALSPVAEDLHASVALSSTLSGRGTPLWRAPELFAPHTAGPTCASDVYSFGVTMWEVLTGTVPYAGLTPPLRDAGDVTKVVAQEGMRPDTCDSDAAEAAATDLARWVPPALAALMRSCWAAAASDRPLSMEAVLSELTEATAVLGAVSARTGAVAVAGAGGTGSATATPTQLRQRNSTHRMTHELLGMGDPLLDISATCGMDLLEKYGLKLNNAIRAEPAHVPLSKELVEKYTVQYIAGGATQNTIRVAQWMHGGAGFSAYSGCIGKDEFGVQLKAAAEADGVTTYYDEAPDVPTGTCAVLVCDKERSLVATLAAASKYSKARHFDSAPFQAVVRGARVVYSAGFFLSHACETMVACGKLAAESGSVYAMNLSAPFLCQIFKKQMHAVLPYADFVFGNESEAAAFAEANGYGAISVEETARRIAALPKVNAARPRVVIFTQGSDPTVVVEGDKPALVVPVSKIEGDSIVDTNGAGDAFVGGFLAYYAKGQPLEAAAKAGHWAAGHIIQRSGCTFDRTARFEA